MEPKTQFLPQYLTDAEGNRIAVVLDLQAYHQMIEQIEELEELQAYDMAIADDDDEIPFATSTLKTVDPHPNLTPLLPEWQKGPGNTLSAVEGDEGKPSN